jgi:hypothetical protein
MQGRFVTRRRVSVHRPESADAWAAVVAFPVGLIGLVVLVVGLAGDSDWWLVGGCLTFGASLVSAVAAFRMQTAGRRVAPSGPLEDTGRRPSAT